ncbi:hypothetical protein [Enterococcus sp. AZ147]|uniref:hypothetical protein n=1 Tax=Enterococcus sp. AZ147 TaxID=2774769 RepID=UPI003F2126BF
MVEQRIKDISYYYTNPLEFEKLLRNIESMESVDNLKDIIDLNTLKTWIKDNIFNIKSLQELLNNYPGTQKKIKSIIGKSLSIKEADTWIQEFLSDPESYQDFPILFSDYNYWLKLSSQEMSKYLYSDFAEYYYILSERKIVNKYSGEILNGLIYNKEKLFENIRLITERTQRNNKLYFPEGFEQSDFFQGMVNSFIDLLEEKNLKHINFIDTLLNFKDTNFPLNELTRARIEQFEKEFWEDNTMKKSSSTFSSKAFIQDQKESVIVNFEDNGITISFDRKTLESLEKDEILTFIIHETFLFDKYGRLCFLYKTLENENTSIEVANKKRKDEYDMPFNRNFQNIFEISTIDLLLNYFEDKNISIESLFAYFFNKQILLNYGIEGFSMDEIDSNMSYSSRNILLAVELESILKQYQLLSKYSEIDLKLLNFMPPLDIGGIGSILKDKYIEVSNEEIPEDIRFSEIKSMFEKCNYVCTKRLPEEAIKKLKGLPSFKQYSTFFSKDEINYLNFTLNNKEFIDSLGIRNAYLHGAGKVFSEKQHENNYLMLVKMFLIVISKIDEELYFDKKANQSKSK